MSGMMSALASVMLQRAYARPRPSGSPDAIAAAQQLLEPRAERVEERHHRPVRSRRSDGKIAVVKGAAFSRACASVMDPGGSLRRLSSHLRHTSTVTRTTITPATSRATATIGHIFLYLSRGPRSSSAIPGRRPSRPTAQWASAVALEC